MTHARITSPYMNGGVYYGKQRKKHCSKRDSKSTYVCSTWNSGIFHPEIPRSGHSSTYAARMDTRANTLSPLSTNGRAMAGFTTAFAFSLERR